MITQPSSGAIAQQVAWITVIAAHLAALIYVGVLVGQVVVSARRSKMRIARMHALSAIVQSSDRTTAERREAFEQLLAMRPGGLQDDLYL